MPKLPLYFALAYIFCFPAAVLSAPLFVMTDKDVRITLTDEKCQLEAVSNLPYRATWTEGGKTFEGCWSVSYDYNRVNTYFGQDRSVVSFPTSSFAKVTGV